MDVIKLAELAVKGGHPLYDSNLTKWPKYREDEDIERLADVLSSRVWGGIPFPGKYTSKCCDIVNQTMKCRYSSLVTNGSDALVVALKAVGILPGDEVITTGYTWVATAGAIIRCNAIPIFADIEKNTCCIDPDDVLKKITSKTKAIIVVHIANQVCDMDAIMRIADKYDIKVIEDCAHAPYAEWKHRCVGTIGDIGTFSFEQSKIITCGEGGMIVTNSTELYKKIGAMVNCGRMLGTDDTFYGEYFGWNHRLSEFQAAVLYGQLIHIKDWMKSLESNVNYLFEELNRRSKCIKPLLVNNKSITQRQFYCVLLYYSCTNVPLSTFCNAVRAEGAELEEKWYYTMNDFPLFHITSREWPYIMSKYGEKIDQDSFDLVVCRDMINNHIIWLHYPSFGDSHSQIDKLIDCIVKVESNLSELI